MRSNIGLILLGLGIAAGSTACTVTNDTSGKTGAGGGTTTASGGGGATGQGGGGTGGQGGQGTGGQGTGGAAANPCGAVPVAGACSPDNTKIQSCFVSEESNVPPKVVETTCDPGTACQVWKGTAACRPTGACFNGDTQCKDQQTLQICTNGQWVDSTCSGTKCIQSPGKGAACTQQDQGAGVTLRGHLDYQFKKPLPDLSDFGDCNGAPCTEGAVDMFITVFDNNELIGMGLTSVGDANTKPGDYSLQLTKQPTAQTYTYFWPMLFDQSGNPRMAIAKAKSDAADFQQADEYWSFGFETCNPVNKCAGSDVDMGSLLIDEANNSGAVHIYQWLDYGIFRVAGQYPNAPAPYSVGVFWNVGNQFDCGSCFAPPQMGGASVTYDAANQLADHYDTSLNISGSDASPHHWSRTTINHEFGHWVMQSYSKSPGEGGAHYVDQASKPGLAYSEGWATFLGQTNISTDNSNNEPIAFRKSQGTVFWVDISKLTWSGGNVELPDPNGALDQPINENVVTAMMWSLWAGANAQAPQNLNDGPMFTALASSRLTGDLNRGYATVDMVDYLDAMKCEKQATADQINAVTAPAHFPYDNKELCQ
jgi:hypothetical protein